MRFGPAQSARLRRRRRPPYPARKPRELLLPIYGEVWPKATEGLATYVVAAHGRGDVGVEVGHLVAGQQQNHYDHQDDQGKDQSVFDQRLAPAFESRPGQHPTWKLHIVAVMLE